MSENNLRYQNGKIYTIRYKDDDDLIYVGSTIQPLYKRWFTHKNKCLNEKDKAYNILLYRKIRETNNINDWYIELYEDYPTSNKENLLKREGEVIREIGTLNKNIAGRTNKEFCKQYYNDNKESFKQYRDNNKEKMKYYNKKYYEDHKLKTKEPNDILNLSSITIDD